MFFADLWNGRGGVNVSKTGRYVHADLHHIGQEPSRQRDREVFGGLDEANTSRLEAIGNSFNGQKDERVLDEAMVFSSSIWN
jgi:hypothetical protein